jgi:hypothetical protein
MSYGRKLGKIKNKYHVIDILSYSYITSDACYLLFTSSTTLRSILLSNFRILINQTTSSLDLPPNPFDFGIKNSKILTLTYPKYLFPYFPTSPQVTPETKTGNHFIVHDDS